MLVAISGAQSTGKTTAILALQEKGYKTKSEITREIAKEGYKINEAGTDETQLKIIEEHINRLKLTDVILDRSLLDGVVYTHYLFEIGQIQEETLKVAQKAFQDNIGKYDALFYIPPEFDIVDDNQRSTNVEFRDRVVQLFEQYIQEYDLDVTYVTGDGSKRLNTIIDKINSLTP